MKRVALPIATLGALVFLVAPANAGPAANELDVDLDRALTVAHEIEAPVQLVGHCYRDGGYYGYGRGRGHYHGHHRHHRVYHSPRYHHYGGRRYHHYSSHGRGYYSRSYYGGYGGYGHRRGGVSLYIGF